MKKLVLVLVATLTFLSCEGPVGPPGPAGDPSVETQWKHIFFTVKQSDWALVGGADQLNSYYEYIFDEPAITDFIYKEGIVLGYLVVNSGTKDEALRPLPDSSPYGQDTNQGESLWTEIINYDYMPGSIAFYVRYNDFYTATPPPTLRFKISMLW
ncbi:hypothetical protein FACS189431_5950 [Alphaproteobacteria bacterium]|nr:hypothetical protein FACS189431_5950 [Alphaproteobacteria bacterium]